MPVKRRRFLLVEELEPRCLLSNYYVAPAGNDNSSGSATAPFATLQHAMMSLQPGDTLNVEPGKYAGFIVGWDDTPASTGDPYGTVNGTASAPIKIQAAPQAAAGSVVINAPNKETPVAIDLEPNCDYITVSGFTINGANSISARGIKVCGNNNVVSNNTISGVQDGFGILVDGGNNVVLQGNTVTGTGNGGSASAGHGIYLSGTISGAVVQGNIIDNNSYIGIHVDGDGGEVTDALIAGNVIYNNGQNGINADGLQSSVIENNLIYGYQSYGICLYHSDGPQASKNNILVNNTIVSTVKGAGAAVRIRDGSTGNIMLNNILLGGSGIAITHQQ